MQQNIGSLIKELRIKKGLTQQQLAEALTISPKTVSKWETQKGIPDISLMEQLGAVLGVSVRELMAGSATTNQNKAGNLARSVFYLCPTCGNIIHSMGHVDISCCGSTLQPLEAKEAEGEHKIALGEMDGHIYITNPHPMQKEHYITFAAMVSQFGMELVKLYPEGGTTVHFSRRGHGWLYICCSRHGLYRRRI